MVCQITLLGRQLFPVYLGIKERNPDALFILYTKETAPLKAKIRGQFPGLKIQDFQIDPYDYQMIQDKVTEILAQNETATYELNLTSGTKLMALAAQQVFTTFGHFCFYIDQKQNIIDLASGEKEKVESVIPTRTFLSLSGHDSYTSQQLKDFNAEEKALAKDIFNLREKNSGIQKLFQLFRSLNLDRDIRNFHHKDKDFTIVWSRNELFIEASRFVLRSKGKNSFIIASTGLWWEIVVASVVEKWKPVKEVFMSFTIKSNGGKNYDKNEVDILINTGQNIFFIECKSGMVTQSDINKINTVGKFYGGIGSKSILVSFFKPKKHLIEKCLDYNIEIFCLKESSNQMQQLQSLNKKLDRLLYRLEL